MELEKLLQRRGTAVREFDEHEHRHDGAHVVASLSDGLNLLCSTLYSRLHEDVEQMIGKDSLIIPVSETKARRLTQTQIDLYQVAESALLVRKLGCVSTANDWYTQWLARLRLGDLLTVDAKDAAQLSAYQSQHSHQRRLAFSDVLARVFPEARHAPLVLFRLFPHAVGIATANAFGAQDAADEMRDQQATELPAIRACQECHGDILKNGQQCSRCGNPLWKSDWLVAVD